MSKNANIHQWFQIEFNPRIHEGRDYKPLSDQFHNALNALEPFILSGEIGDYVEKHEGSNHIVQFMVNATGEEDVLEALQKESESISPSRIDPPFEPTGCRLR